MASPQPTAADKNLRILVVGSDPMLEQEFVTALSGVPDRKGVVSYVDTYREAVDVARRRPANVVAVEIDRPTGEVAGFVKDLRESSPGTAIVGVYRPDRLEQGRSESGTIIELLRAHVQDFLRRPLSATELRASLDRVLARPVAAAPAAQGCVAAFLSNKGGVGKSTLAVNVACALALQHPDEVLLIDSSLQVGMCAMMLDLKTTTSIVDAIRERDRLDRTLLRHLTLRHGSGLRLLAAPLDALEGAEVDDEAIARIVNMARRAFKFVIVDTFPMLDNVLMTILDLTDAAFVVVQGTAPAVAGIARFLPVLDGLGLQASRQRIVLNYNYPSFLGNLQPGDIGGRLRRDIDYVVAYDKQVLVSMNTGSPRVIHAGRWDRFGKMVRQIADDLGAFAVDSARQAEPADIDRIRRTSPPRQERA
jgi:pilus assembly protein CpaE